MQDMASLLEQETIKEFTPHEVIKGTVVLVNHDEAYVDIGYKMEIPVHKRELAYPEPASAMDVVQVGDEIDVYVTALGGEHGVSLSKTRADSQQSWSKMEKIMEEKGTLDVVVSSVVKGGLLTSAMGLRGFIPASQIALHFVKDLTEFVGQTLTVRPIEVDPRKKRLVLSRREILEEERQNQRAEILSSIVEGEKRLGTVKRLVDYGAFIDIGGVDGLAHISDLSWEHVKNPADILNIGDEVEVIVKSYDPEKGRISLSIKDTQEDPWYAKADKYPVGSQVEGTIVKLTDFGAFMELEPGFDGLIRMKELSPKHINNASEVVAVGDKVLVKVIHIDKDNKKVALSINRVQQDAERKDYEDYQATQESAE